MRLGYVTRRAAPASGGIESFLQRLSLRMAERHDVAIVAQRIDSDPNRPILDAMRRRPFPPFMDGPVPVRPFALSPARRAAVAPLMLQASGKLRRTSVHGRAHELLGASFGHLAAPPLARALAGAEVVHVMGGYEIACAGVAAAQRLEVPVVVSPFAHPGHWDDDAASAWAYRRADRIVATLDSDAATYRELGVPDERIEVIGLFCETPPDGLEPAALRERHGIDGPLVVFLGGRWAHKGVETLIAASEQVEATFAFVGPGAPVHGRRVLDVGLVSDRERWEWLAAADLLALPSRGETFGLVLLEAWAVNTAVVTSDIPALAELVGRARGGVAVERTVEAQARALRELLAAPEHMRGLAASGHRYWFEHGRPERVIARLEALYDGLVAQRMPAAP